MTNTPSAWTTRQRHTPHSQSWTTCDHGAADITGGHWQWKENGHFVCRACSTQPPPPPPPVRSSSNRVNKRAAAARRVASTAPAAVTDPLAKKKMRQGMCIFVGIVGLGILGAIFGGNGTSSTTTAPAATTVAVASTTPSAGSLVAAAPDFSSWTSGQIAQAATDACSLFVDNNGSLSAVENAEASTNTAAGSDLTPTDLADLILYSVSVDCPTYLPTVKQAMS